MPVRKAVDTPEAAYEAAVKFLTRKARTEAEVRAELVALGAAQDAIESVLERLKANRHLDDAVLATDLAFSLIEGKGLAPVLAVHKLMERGIAEKLASDAIASAVEGRNEAALCRAALARRLKGRPLSASECVKEGRALARLGYEEDVITRALERALDGDGD